jgi:hypothetical protein
LGKEIAEAAAYGSKSFPRTSRSPDRVQNALGESDQAPIRARKGCIQDTEEQPKGYKKLSINSNI